MSVSLEYGKLKRTGFYPAFTGGGLLAAAIPIANTALRQDVFTSVKESPFVVLMDANWQMMAMLNVFMIVIGACIVYHIEYADNALQKMEALPAKGESMFFSKCFVLAAASVFMIALETAALAFCVRCWFSPPEDFAAQLFSSMGFATALSVPAVILMTGISSACRNMWISLGIGVIGIFATVVIPPGSLILSMFPFTLPFQAFSGAGEGEAGELLLGALVEMAVFCAAELVYLRIRRNVQ